MMFEKFIRGTDEFSTYFKPVPAPILRKNFKLDFAPEKSELFICVSGFYELYINGKNITKTRLAPFVNNPDHILYYDDYEVSQYLQKGENAVAVILGNGFANQDSPRIDFNKCPFRAPLVMSLYLKVENGKEQFVLESDESFKVHSSPILYDMYRFGVIYDAREEIDGFASGDFDDSSWENAKFATPPKGKITLSTAVPITDQYELKPQVVEKLHDVYCFHDNAKKPIENTFVKEGWWFDFGYARAGVCRMKIKGERGQKITLRHSESARYGKFNMNTTITLKEGDEEYLHLFQTDTYILKGGEEEIFVPAFTYHGFRYVLVEGLKDEQVTDEVLTFIVFNTNVKKRSGFNCSDEILNTLYDMGISSDLSNLMHIPTDCPAREKNGWTDDASMSACQFLLSFDISENLRMWMQNISLAQREDGMLPGVVPTHSWGYHWGNGPVSDSAIINLPYYVYKFCGRTDVFEENTELVSRYFRFIAGTRDERGLINWGLPDWCQARIPDAERRTTPTAVVSTMQLYEMLERGALLFGAIGNNQEKEYALNLKAELKAAMREHLIDFETYTVSGFCQTGQVLALKNGIFEPDEYKKGYKRLLEIIEYDNYTIACGIVGLRNLFHVLSENGDIDIALRMITKKEGPSYRTMIDRGGTSLFECLIHNGVQESENHHMNGDIVNLFISKLAGLEINPEMDDIYNVLIDPKIPESIDSASAWYAYPDGQKTEVCWEKNNGTVKLRVNLPECAHGKVKISGELIELKIGVNEFVLKKEKLK